MATFPDDAKGSNYALPWAINRLYQEWKATAKQLSRQRLRSSVLSGLRECNKCHKGSTDPNRHNSITKRIVGELVNALRRSGINVRD